MNKAIFIALLMLSSLGGCLGGDDTAEEVEIELGRLQMNAYHSHQFNNYAPMGTGNHSTMELNTTNASVILNITLDAWFHEPPLWSKGFANVTILDDNETVIWEQETDGGMTNYSIIISDNYTFTGNLTIRILSEGSDNATDDDVADWYIVDYTADCVWVME